jgi:hypothetical protein
MPISVSISTASRDATCDPRLDRLDEGLVVYVVPVRPCARVHKTSPFVGEAHGYEEHLVGKRWHHEEARATKPLTWL